VTLSIFGATVRPCPDEPKGDGMKYMVLIYDDESTWGGMSEGERGDHLERYGALAARSGVLAGEGLKPTSTATTVRVRSDEALLTDGPFAETREQLGGFFLLDVPSLDEALSFARDVPAAAHGSVEVRPVGP
jgi:hypothetical protein